MLLARVYEYSTRYSYEEHSGQEGVRGMEHLSKMCGEPHSQPARLASTRMRARWMTERTDAIRSGKKRKGAHEKRDLQCYRSEKFRPRA